MSDQETWAWHQHPSNSTAKLVLICLARNSSPRGLVFISQAGIAEQCGIGQRTVVDALKSLELSRHIDRSRRVVGGRRTIDRIQIRLTPLMLFGRKDRAARVAYTLDDGPSDDDGLDAGVADSPYAEAASTGDDDGRLSYARVAQRGVLPTQPKPTGQAYSQDVQNSQQKWVPPCGWGVLGEAADAIWKATPEAARARINNDLGKVRLELQDMLKIDPRLNLADVVTGMVAFYGGFHGDQPPPPNWALRDNRWVGARPTPPPRKLDLKTIATMTAEERIANDPFGHLDGVPNESRAERIVEGRLMVINKGRLFEVPIGGTVHPIGPWENPGILKQLDMVEAWKLGEERWRIIYGPKPSDPGCRLWPSVRTAFNIPAAQSQEESA